MTNTDKHQILQQAFIEIYDMIQEIKEDWNKLDYDRYISGIRTMLAIQDELRVLNESESK